jgi:drug/metabolite transporter (DMT)-like permease
MVDSNSTASARLLVIAMGFGWGFNWIAARYILPYVPPWSMRALGIGLGALTLFAIARIGRIRLAVPKDQWIHIAAASVLNVLLFNVCSAYAQVFGTTSRAVVIAYSMPIWSAFLAWLVLKDKFDTTRVIALALCAAGLAVLIGPLAIHGLPLGALFALGCAWLWAGGTIYLKWANIRATSIAITMWQLIAGWIGLAIGALWFDGLPHYGSLPADVIGWIAYNGILGMGVSYFLWFMIVERLPAMTASIGSLLVPVIGVTASTLLLGERPTTADITGFALIFAAAACVLLRPNTKRAEMPE